MLGLYPQQASDRKVANLENQVHILRNSQLARFEKAPLRGFKGFWGLGGFKGVWAMGLGVLGV